MRLGRSTLILAHRAERQGLLVIVFLALIIVASIASVALLIAMFVRDDCLHGVWGIIGLCFTGMAGAAYGMLSSL